MTAQNSTLFTIKQSHLETGMRGFPVGYCSTSFVDPEKGVYYRGRSIKTLASKHPSEVIYLLFKGSFGSEKKVKYFAKKFSQIEIPLWLPDMVNKIPRNGNLMHSLSALLNVCAACDSTGNYKKDGLNLIALMPHLIGFIVKDHALVDKTVKHKKNQGLVETFVNYTGVADEKKRKLMCSALNLFCILHLDHGGGNLSTFVGKAVASGGCNIYSAMASALSALSGPLHGGANKDAIEFIDRIEKSYNKMPTDEQIKKYVEHKLKNNEIIPGFGHAVLRAEDPRASVLYDYALKHFPKNKSVKIALQLRRVVPEVLKNYPKIKNPYPNVDAISGVVLNASGFGSFPEFFPLYFALARSVGIVRQIIYERCEARNGKGTPIVRPKYFYKEPQISKKQ